MPAAVLGIISVSKRYGDAVAVDELTVTVLPGELVGLAGGPGAGKTTALRIALGILEPDDGLVTVSGTPVNGAVRARMGHLPQRRGLYPRMRVLDQLVYLAQLHGLSTNDAHRNAERVVDRLGLGRWVGDRGASLPDGLAQRVALAGALVHDPDVLVLDDPFAGLDPDGVELAGEVLAERAATGVAVLLACRQLDQVQRRCHRAVIMSAGRLVASGDVTSLRKRGGRLLVVSAPAAPAGWASAVPGVQVVSVHNGRTTLALSENADDQAVLAAALATGPVTEFSTRLPDLAELFRSVVSVAP